MHFWGTTIHKIWVVVFIVGFCSRLLWRGLIHDFSKYSIVETQEFVKVIHLLKYLKYGSDDYKKSLETIKPAIDHHYSHNRHHPEYWVKNQGISEDKSLGHMNLIDLVEMLCDWKASVKRHKTGSICKSIEINQIRFSIPEVLGNILRNSVKKSK